LSKSRPSPDFKRRGADKRKEDADIIILKGRRKREVEGRERERTALSRKSGSKLKTHFLLEGPNFFKRLTSVYDILP